MKRLIFDIVYRDKRWHIDLRGLIKLTYRMSASSIYENKTECIREAVILCNYLWDFASIPCQLVIRKMNGQIQSERTYPDVPPERKG